MKSYNIFVYGTLILPAVQQQVLQRVVDMQPDTLSGYAQKLVRINGVDYPAAEPHATSKIKGKLFQDITKSELVLLDNYETSAYQRKLVKLGSGCLAWVYCRAD